MDNFELNTVWTKVLEHLEPELGVGTIEMWLKPIKPLMYNAQNNKMILEMPDKMSFQTFKSRYELKAVETIKKLFAKDISIDYTIAIAHITADEPVIPVHQPVKEAAGAGHEQPSKKNIIEHKLNPNYTFENFIEADSNKFAYNVAKSVVNKLGKKENNPFVVHSTPGLGKTHLLHAIGNEIIKNNPNKRVLYLSGEEFVNEYLDSLQKKASDTFRKKYRNLDCFLIDDIQFVADKLRSADEFFYTFNTLYEMKKQIVCSSDKTPTELGMEERLYSRLMSGVVTEIKSPGVETRIAILRAKREAIGAVHIPNDVLEYIAKGLKGSIRELEGALFNLNTYCSAMNIPATVDIAREILSNVIVEDNDNRVDIKTVIKVVSKHFNVDVADLKSKRRQKSITWPRQVAMYLANELTKSSVTEIADAFNRDHSTFYNSKEKVAAEFNSNPFFSAEINKIISDIRNVDKKST